jgi:Histidine phosphatase superfamily (branch 2)
LETWQKTRESEWFAQRAREEHAFVRDVLGRLKSPLAESSAVLPSKKLTVMTYVWELLDCELYFPVPRTAVTDAISIDEREKVHELARWVWAQRFQKSGHGRLIGGRLLDEVVSGLQFDHQDESQCCFASYSCHDYTILALMSALGADDYHGRVLGYGASVIFEAWQIPDASGEDKIKVRVVLNTHPFEHKGLITDEVQWNPQIFTPPYFDDDGMILLPQLAMRAD